MAYINAVAFALCAFLFVVHGEVIDGVVKNFHLKQRIIKCTEGKPLAQCKLLLDLEPEELDAGCFEEKDKDGTPKVYCKLSGVDALECTALSKTPNNNHLCNKYYNYQIEKRDDEFYLWRSGECVTQAISILVHCRFPAPTGAPPAAA